ncbi:hypothetical protein NQ317_012371 [Molorchus minor]|uniref:Uncharacterized protein n=1 Tax=Molorchus minor TaxID=1323400 RepID=A0ABQ9JQ55_9CUCU|nr:hypothetical protein NQ317_012371 [Molorchus minor]
MYRFKNSKQYEFRVDGVRLWLGSSYMQCHHCVPHSQDGLPPGQRMLLGLTVSEAFRQLKDEGIFLFIQRSFTAIYSKNSYPQHDVRDI